MVWKKVFCFALTLVLNCASSGVAGTVGFWTFEHGSGGTTASGVGSIHDYSGNGNHGTPQMSPTYESVQSGFGSIAMGFYSGVNQKVLFDDSLPFRITGSLTIEAVIRYDGSLPGNSYGHNMILFRGDDRGGLDPYYLSVTNDRLSFVVSGESINSNSTVWSDPLVHGQWYHVAAVLNGVTGRQSIFIDQTETAYTYTAVRPFATLDALANPGVAIGGAQSGNFQFGFGGVIDQVRLSNTATSFGAQVPEPATATIILSMLAMYRIQRRRSSF